MTYDNKLMKNKIHGILKISSKNAATKGTTKKALAECPYFCVTEFIFAKALGVAPRP